MDPRVGIISQARMTSTRLPGKVLLEAAGQPMLHWHFLRLADSGLPAFLATTVHATDDPVVRWAAGRGIPAWRGSEDDVLARFHGCAQMARLDVIVRVTADCPLIDGHLLRALVDDYLALGDARAYLCNSAQTYPRGLDVEVFSRQLLEEAHARARTAREREHVTPYLYQGKDPTIRIVRRQLPEDKSHLRFTLDTEDDLRLVRALIEQHGAADLGYQAIIALLEAHPELRALNAHVEQRRT